MLRPTLLSYFGKHTSCYVLLFCFCFGKHASCYVLHFCGISVITLHATFCIFLLRSARLLPVRTAAWRSEAIRLQLRHVSVNHQNKEFVRKDRKNKRQKGSTMAGT